MKVQDIKLEHIAHILSIWEEDIGKVPFYVNAEKIYDDLQRSIHDDFKRHVMNDGYRIGSRWTGHSKLAFDISYGTVRVHFKPNMIPQESGGEEADKVAEAFHIKVSEYLESQSSSQE